MENLHRRTWYFLINSIFALWLLATVVVVTFHRFFVYPVWLMVHVTLLGAVSTAIYIWSQHFADTLTRKQAPGGRKLFALRFTAHTIGAVLVVAGMVTNTTLLLLLGVILVCAAALSHTLVMTLQLRGALASRFGKLVRFYAVAGGWLALGAGLGFWISQLTGSDTLREKLFLTHAIINIFGWIGTTVIGTIILFLPTVLHARMREQDGKRSGRVLLLLTLATAVFALGAVLNIPQIAALGLLLWGAGLVIVLREAWFQVRGAGWYGYAGLSLIFALVWVTVLLAALFIAVLLSNDIATAISRFDYFLPVLIFGFAAQVVIGSLSYLLAVIMGSPKARKAAEKELDRAAVFRVTSINASAFLYLLPLPSIAKVLLSLFAFIMLLSFVPLAVRGIFAAAKARKAEAGVLQPQGLQLQKPEPAPQKPQVSGQIVTAFGAIILLLAASIAAAPAAAGINTLQNTAVVEQPSTSIAETQVTTQTTVIKVHVEGMKFVPATLEVAAGNELVVEFTNTGTDTHDITFANGISSKRLQPGESETVAVGVITQSMLAWCSITGHRAMGMEAEIVVTGDHAGTEEASESQASESQDLDTQASTDQEHAQHHDAPVLLNSDSAADFRVADFEAADAALQPAPDAKIHKITLPVTEQIVEVAPGITQNLWSYGGEVPGPVLRGKVGDSFEITLVNEGTIGHSIDFHAGVTPPDEVMRTIAPGESLVYKFTAERAGIWMYHCSTPLMSAHIANGMFGAVIIDPPDLNDVDQEMLLVQSEFYLGAADEEVDVAKVATQMPDLVTFNGYANQYLYDPISARAGETLRVWLLDVGPNVQTAFHVVGGQFHTVFKEGEYLLKDGGSTGVGGSQVLDLAVAQGGFVELTLPEAGNYPFVTHIMSDAEKGASGVISVK